MADLQGRKIFKVFNQDFIVDERYTVTKELGQGAYGIVWYARALLLYEGTHPMSAASLVRVLPAPPSTAIDSSAPASSTMEIAADNSAEFGRSMGQMHGILVIGS